MKAKVKSVIPRGTYDSNYGLMYKYEISIGEHTGEYSSKKYETKDAKGFPFIIDSEVEYEYTPDEKYPKIKPAQTGSYSGGYKKSNGGNTSFGVSYCKDLIIAGKLPIDQWESASEKIINFMNKLDNK